jgi:hypothetical protein
LHRERRSPTSCRFRRAASAVAALAGPVPSSVAFRSARLTDAIAKMAVTTTFDLVFGPSAFRRRAPLPF